GTGTTVSMRSRWTTASEPGASTPYGLQVGPSACVVARDTGGCRRRVVPHVSPYGLATQQERPVAFLVGLGVRRRHRLRPTTSEDGVRGGATWVRVARAVSPSLGQNLLQSTCSIIGMN